MEKERKVVSTTSMNVPGVITGISHQGPINYHFYPTFMSQTNCERFKNERSKVSCLLHENAERALNVMDQKSHDYATDKDPFSNFRACEEYGIPVEHGILIRMSDKMSRIGNLLNKKEQKVPDESIYDTLIDLMNYSNLLAVYLMMKEDQ